jgi:hypothetical protein
MTLRTIALPMIFLTVFRGELGGFLPAAVTDRTAVGRFDVTLDFAFSYLDVRDLDVGKIQQLFELNLHSDAFIDDCWFMTPISWGISRQLPKSRNTPSARGIIQL